MPRTRASWWLTVPVVLAAATTPADVVSARYRIPEIERVPVERLIANLQEARKKAPGDVEPVLNLGRLHAMVYALRSDTVPALASPSPAAWFGLPAPRVPFVAVVPTQDPDTLFIATQHLNRAIAMYDTARRMAPNDMVVRLGYAWLLTQAHRNGEAVPLLRSLVAEAWLTDRNLTSVMGSPLMVEAATYLIPLLDKQRDRAEIDTIDARAALFDKLPRRVTPIAVPLEDGLTATDLENGAAAVAFDADGSDLNRKWTWITPRAAWLVHDPPCRGQITSGLQLFGGVSFWLFWRTGYDALAALDDNGDGELRAGELDGLALWRDANGNGVSDPGEVKPLAAYHIVSLSTQFQRDARHPDHIAYSKVGVTFANGGTRPTYDLILHQVTGDEHGRTPTP